MKKKQTDRKTDRQTNRQTDGQTDMLTKKLLKRQIKTNKQTNSLQVAETEYTGMRYIEIGEDEFGIFYQWIL